MKKMPAEFPAAATPRLLLIEDDVRLCHLVKEYLEAMGYAVSMQHTGPSGLDTALREPFQAVILDVMLSGMAGSGVLPEPPFPPPVRAPLPPPPPRHPLPLLPPQ